MSRKIILGKTYYTPSGEEFVPVKVERGKIKRSLNFWSGEQRKCSVYIDQTGKRLKKINICDTVFGKLKAGSIVSHDDYSCELFKVISIDKETGIVETKGGKNGTWINHIDLIIRFPNKNLDNPHKFHIN